MEATRGPYDFYTGLHWPLAILTIPARSPYGFLLVRCRKMTKKLHDGHKKCKHARHRPQTEEPVWKNRGSKTRTAPVANLIKAYVYTQPDLNSLCQMHSLVCCFCHVWAENSSGKKDQQNTLKDFKNAKIYNYYFCIQKFLAFYRLNRIVTTLCIYLHPISVFLKTLATTSYALHV